MATARGNQLAQDIRQRVEELKKVCAGVDENTACRAPADRWSPKEIISHLCGPPGQGHLPMLREFLERDNLTININTENPFFTGERAQASFAQLVAECEAEYGRIAKFAAELNEDQLMRKATIPQFKDSPLGENPTLSGVIGGLGQYHLQFHIDHLREILLELSK